MAKRKTAAKPDGFRVLNERIEMVPIDSIRPSPENVNQGDLGAVIDSVGRHGFYGCIVAQKSTREIIAGEFRWRAAQHHGAERVPVAFVDVTDAQARRMRLVDNRSTRLGMDDPAALARLLQELSLNGELEGTGFDAEALDNLLHDLTIPLVAESEKSESEDVGQIYALREDALFPSSNKWGIPDLLPEMLATQLPHRLWIGGQCDDPKDHLFIFRTAKFGPEAKGGVLAFYIDDWRFENLWSDAVTVVEEFLQFGWGAIVTPDFSVWRDDPMAAQLWNVYRSRWCARYWQAAGIKVIPSLNWSDERSYEFALAGLPPGIPVASIQCRTTGSKKGKDFFIAGIRHALEQVRPGAVIVYGGLDHRSWLEPALPTGSEYIWLDSWIRARTRRGVKHEEAGLAA